VMYYSLGGQPDVAVPITNEIISNDNGLATVNGLAATTISDVAKDAHSQYIHGQTTFSQHSSSRTPLNMNIYFIVETVTPPFKFYLHNPKLTIQLPRMNLLARLSQELIRFLFLIKRAIVICAWKQLDGPWISPSDIIMEQTFDDGTLFVYGQVGVTSITNINYLD
jgi:hypothetical protein